MKYIVKIIVSAFALISAAACYNNEIENPDNPQNPEQPGLRITATLAKTRVSFGNEDSNNIYPEWEEGDILFGFYGDDPDDNGIVLKVYHVNEGVAYLEIVSGEIADQNLGTDVCLIYTGCNEEDLSDEIDPDDFKFSADGKFPVNLAMQNRDRIPVCMSATATIEGSAAAKTLEFSFKYDCAILEIQSLRGFKEDDKEAIGLGKIEVTNLILDGIYKYNSNTQKIGLEPGTLTSAYTVSGDDLNDWGVNDYGELVNDNTPTGFLIAVIPNSEEENIEVKVYDSASAQDPYFTHPCTSTTISAGRCYVVRSEEVVAKTIDGLYFTTVKAAFDRAAEIADELKIDPTLYDGYNIVTLVKDEIEGLGAPASGWWNDGVSSNGEYEVDLMIDIDYDVILDLNNFNLLLCCTYDDDWYPDDNNKFSGGFYVKPSANFSIIDNSDDESGHIRSGSNAPIIINEGNVTIYSGYLYNYVEDICTIQNCSSGHFLISDGEIYSQENNALDNYGIAVIKGGEVDSYNGRAVYSCGELTINGGEVYTQDFTAIIVDDNDSDNDIEVNFTMNQGAVYATYSGGADKINGYDFSLPAIRLIGNVTGIISGGTIEGADIALEVLFGADCTISGGIVRSTDGKGPAVLCYTNIDDGNTQLTVKWPDDYDKDTTEPLISTSETNYIFTVPEHNFTPICAYSSQGSDYANVVIKGGYLFSYESSFFCSTPECLVYSESENFFTNTPYICTKGDSGTTFSLYDDPDDSEDQKKNSTCLMASFDSERSIQNPFDEDVSYLPFPYKIVKKPANAAEGNTDKYTFTPYGW